MSSSTFILRSTFCVDRRNSFPNRQISSAKESGSLKNRAFGFSVTDFQSTKKVSTQFSNRNENLKSSERLYANKNNRTVFSSAEYESLKGIQVFKVSTGEPVELVSLWEREDSKTAVIPFLTHFADLSSWEYAQKLTKKVIPYANEKEFVFAAVGLGSVENAKKFSEILSFPIDQLYADPEGACHKALQFSPGFGKDIPINPYLKLFPMLLGIGSPGTIQEVLRGYVGDRDSQEIYSSSPFDILGKGYQRPFELATLRLFNMVGILPKWGELSPPQTELLTQQGGTVVFNGSDTLFRYDDSGILKYTDVDLLLEKLNSI